MTKANPMTESAPLRLSTESVIGPVVVSRIPVRLIDPDVHGLETPPDPTNTPVVASDAMALKSPLEYIIQCKGGMRITPGVLNAKSNTRGDVGEVCDAFTTVFHEGKKHAAAVTVIGFVVLGKMSLERVTMAYMLSEVPVVI